MNPLQILTPAAQGKMKRVHINPEHFPMMKNFKTGNTVGAFTFGGHDDNGNQMWINNARNVVLSNREKQVYKLRNLSNQEIAQKLGISEKSVRSYREKIESKGF
jgi:DNA-binding NarL/FixJ family response regulator